MKIAILHYHLNTGGVTRVIMQQATVLQNQGHDVLLLAGESTSLNFPVSTDVIHGLGYDRNDNQEITVDSIADHIIRSFYKRWNQLPDVVHIHNPILAKNHRTLDILNRLHHSSLPLLCQVHDFAEDGRPEVYFPDEYPADCHYAVVNMRDYRILSRAGLSEKGLHYLPNPVSPWPPPQEQSEVRKGSILYPVRAIRRKNVGEAILFHACCQTDMPLLITQPPTSKQDLPAYAFWQTFSYRHDLDVHFGAGINKDFGTLTTQCEYVLTTSINEGFGFAFLESWTAGKMLWGRLLPEICHDFTQQGLELNHLYSKIQIPISWLDIEILRDIWSQVLDHAVRTYQFSFSQKEIASGWDDITAAGYIDFGLLDEFRQSDVIRRVLENSSDREQLIGDNPILGQSRKSRDYHSIIDRNRRIVLERFNMKNYGEKLVEIYKHVATDKVIHRPDKKIIAAAFLSPAKFSLLKWSPFYG